MIQSMTGYGKAVLTYGEKKINVEVKSLNSKTMDLSTRIAPLYREKEMEIRQMLTRKLVRGKVDFSIWIEKDEVTDAATINAALVDTRYVTSPPRRVFLSLRTGFTRCSACPMLPLVSRLLSSSPRSGQWHARLSTPPSARS